jgi:hypothetical protein
MSFEGLINIRKAISTLNPKQVRELAEHSPRIALFAGSPDSYQRLEDFFLRDLSPARRRESAALLVRSPSPMIGQNYDLAVYSDDLNAPPKALVLDPHHPHRFVAKTLAKYPNLGVPLAKSFLPFRRPYVHHVISNTCRENTLFSLATALPDIVPSLIELPWAIAEFASDTAFLTMNQVRMTFLIAAASDREVGYLEQKSEIATVIGSAFGWRAFARQLVGKIPFGGGLIGKAAIAYAGTKVLGLSLDQFYSIGFTYTRAERDEIYTAAFRQGKRVAIRILGLIRPDLLDKYAKREPDTVPSRPVSGIQLVSRGRA